VTQTFCAGGQRADTCEAAPQRKRELAGAESERDPVLGHLIGRSSRNKVRPRLNSAHDLTFPSWLDINILKRAEQVQVING
jgi:hypothetical protein